MTTAPSLLEPVIAPVLSDPPGSRAYSARFTERSLAQSRGALFAAFQTPTPRLAIGRPDAYVSDSLGEPQHERFQGNERIYDDPAPASSPCTPPEVVMLPAGSGFPADIWGARIRTWGHGTKTRCLTTWPRPNSDSARRVPRMLRRHLGASRAESAVDFLAPAYKQRGQHRDREHDDSDDDHHHRD
jgi:hypothetical protein